MGEEKETKLQYINVIASAMKQCCTGCLFILYCLDYIYALQKYADANSSHLAPIYWPSKASHTDSKSLGSEGLLVGPRQRKDKNCCWQLEGSSSGST